MTYDGLFEKCKTLSELHKKYDDLRKECDNELSKFDCRRAYLNRREEIKKQYREGCFG